MSQAEEDILTALIMQHTVAYYEASGDRKVARASESSARIAAKKIMECGFSMASRPVDDLQDAEIEELRLCLEQLRGWTGLPSELRRRNA